jgi:hypothetical protein
MLNKITAKCKKKIHQIGKSELRLIKSSGLAPFFEFMKNRGLKEMIDGTFKDYRWAHKVSFLPYQYFYLIIFQLLDGNLRTFAYRLQMNANLLQIILGAERIPHYTSVIKFMNNMTRASITSLRRLFLKIAITAVGNQIRAHDLKTLTIDVDSTAGSLFGSQEGVAKGYNPQDKNEKCLHLQLWTIRELKLILFMRLRKGNTHCSNNIIRDAKLLIPILQEMGVKVRFVADSGYEQKELFEYLDEMGVGFVVAQKQFQKIVTAGKNAKKKNIYLKYKAVVKERKSEIMGRRFRQIFLKVAEAVTETGQLLFPEMMEGFTNVVITNMDNNFKWLYRFYRKHAQVETIIEEIKNDFGVLKSKGHHLCLNQGFTQLVGIAYNLKNIYAKEILKLKGAIPKAGTMREMIFQIPGYLSNLSGKIHLKIADNFYRPIKNAFDAAKEKASWRFSV